MDMEEIDDTNIEFIYLDKLLEYIKKKMEDDSNK